VQEVELQFRARWVAARSAEFSIDGGEVVPGLPGRRDRRLAVEDFQTTTPTSQAASMRLPARERRHGNTGTAKLIVRIP